MAVSAQADVVVTKQVNRTAALVGDRLIYTVTVTNLGPSDARSVRVTDNLPAGLAVVSVTPAQTSGSNPLVWDLGDMGPGAVRTLVVAGDVTSAAPSAILRNAVTAISSTPDPSLGTNSASASTLVARPAISVDKSASAQMVHSGDRVTYTVVVSNTGSVPLAQVAVADDRCQPLTFLDGDTNGNLLLESGERWRYRCVGTLSANTTNTATASGQPAAGDGTPLTDLAPITGQDTATVTVIHPAMILTKSADRVMARTGETINYTLLLTNSGDVPLSTVAISDNRCTPLVLAAGDSNNNTVLDVGEVWRYTCAHTVVAGDPDPFVNSATATARDPLGLALTHTATATVDLIGPQMDLSKQANTVAAIHGETVTYTYRLTNTGNVALASPTVVDDRCSPVLYVGGDLNNSLGLDVGEAWRFSCSYVVQAGDPNPLVNTATATATDPAGNPLTDTATASIATSAPGRLAASKVLLVASGQTALPGDTLTYRLVVSNVGGAAVADVVIEDTPDVNTRLVVGSVTTTAGNVVQGNGSGHVNVRVEVASLAPGAAVTVEFRVTIANPFPTVGAAQIRNQATASGRRVASVLTDDPSLPGAADPTVIDVFTGVPVLSAKKSTSLYSDGDGSGNLTAGDALQYQILIENTGTAPAQNLVFTDTLDPNTTLVVGTTTTNRGVVAVGNRPGDTQVRVDVGLLDVGATVTIRLWVRINDPLPAGVTQIVNQGSLSGLGLGVMATDDPAVGGQSDATQIPLSPKVYKIYLPLLLKPGAVAPTPTPTVTPVPTPTPTPMPTPTPGSDSFLGVPIDGLLHPKSMGLDLGGAYLYIASRDNNQLLKLDAATFAVVGRVATGAEPWGVGVNPNTNRVYVANFGSADVWVYDATTLALVKKIVLGNPGEIQPTLIEMLPAIDTVAVSLRGQTGNAVAIIEGTQVKQILAATGTGTYGLASDPVNNQIFVVNRDSANVRVIYRNPFGTWLNDGYNFTYSDRAVPFEAAFNPNNQKLYVVYVIDTAWFVDVFQQLPDRSFLKRATVSVGRGWGAKNADVGGTGLAVNLATNNVFNVNTQDDTISVINGETNLPVATLSTGRDPFTIAINTVTRTVYVALRAVNRLVSFPDIY